MAAELQALLGWIQLHPGYAGIVLFLLAFSESMAVIGVLVPGVLLMFGVGALIGAGALDFWQMCAWAVAGAVAGDSLSFWLGQHFSSRLRQIWPFSRHPETLDRGMVFFDRWGGKSVALGRFFGPIRAVIPLVAGMCHMPPQRFLLANVLSALVWAPAYLLPGVVFGASLDLASEVASRLVLLLLLLLVLLWGLGWGAHRVVVVMQPHSQQLLRGLLGFAEKRSWLGEIGRALGDPDHREAAGLARLAALLLLAILAVAGFSLLTGAPLETADRAFHTGLRGLATPTVDLLMAALAALAGNAAILAALLAGWMLLRLYHRDIAARHWLIGVSAGWGLALLLQYLGFSQPGLARSLPDPVLMRGAPLFAFTAILAGSALIPARRWPLYSLATILIALVTLAQLYHGARLSMLLVTLALTLTWISALGVAYRTHGSGEPLQRHQALNLGGLMLLLSLGSAFSTDSRDLPPLDQPMPLGMETDIWLTGGWRELPQDREDIQLSRRPLNLQFLGSRKTLTESLGTAGWVTATPIQGKDWLALLAPNGNLENLPVLPHSHAGRYPSLTLIKPLAGHRLVLRLWLGKVIGLPQGKPIWLGTVSAEKEQRNFLFHYPVTSPDYAGALQAMTQDLRSDRLRQHYVSQDKLLLLEAGQTDQ